MNPTMLESAIAEATKRYVQHEWRLDVETFGRTRERAWVGLAGRILDRSDATIPVKGLQIECGPPIDGIATFESDNR